ncbi:hypothetical protein ACNJ7E_03125 [Rhodococcus sp. NM-2]|uniref:hypothetical protein n=1 Tax=Rhodococcus sp. NM-2 TaxID=3401174 RepID=UPI003AAEC99D
MLSEAVDHAVAAQDPDRAVHLVESGGPELIENSRMATLLGLVAKLPPAETHQYPELPLLVAWGNVLLQHPAATQSSLERLYSGLDAESRSADQHQAIRREADLIQAVGRVFADQVEGVQDLIDDILQHPDEVRPFVASGASDVASFLAVHSFDFATARRWQEWAGNWTVGPFSVMYGYCMAGVAAYEILDIREAESKFRTALELAILTGVHSHAARLAGALLGSLLYEKGDVDAAEELLDRSNELGSEGGVVDILLATYGVGSRIKALRGDHAAAAIRLDEGMAVAARLSISRLDKRVVNERIRAGLPLDPGTSARLRKFSPPTEGQGGIAEECSQLDEESSIRMLLTDRSDAAVQEALRRSRVLVARVATQKRPRALVAAIALEVCCLAAAGREDEAKQTFAPIVLQCVALGLPRVLLDGGAESVGLLSTMLAEYVRAKRGYSIGLT